MTCFLTRYYDPRIIIWYGVDPLAEKHPDYNPFVYTANNPIKFIDPDGRDWVEEDYSLWEKVKQFFGAKAGPKQIKWHEGVNSQKDLGKDSKDKWLGKNVVVATHNRDKDFNEPLNTAQFDVYLESCHDGPSATFYGNTVAADIDKGGVLSPGLYSAISGHRSKAKYQNETALLIGGGGILPSEKPNPRHGNRNEMDGIFLHSGNPYQASLFDSNGNAYSTGCQTTGCGPSTATNRGASNHEIFKAAVGSNFNGKYYLRGR